MGLGRQGHPKGLYLLFATEMWERFSYYGMRALLVLYLTKSLIDGGLGFTDDNASLLYGFFTGFVYFTPLIGGWLADNYLGQRKAIVIGAILMMLGQFSLATETSLPFLYTGLVLLIIGNGFFKPNISVIVGKLYEPGDPRKDSAFTIFYMGINVGAFFAPLLTGYMALTYGYRYGFLVAGIGMLFGLLVFTILGNRYLGEVGKAPSCKAKDSSLENVPLTKEEKDRTLAIVVFVLFSIFFFAGFEQAGSSMTLYTEKYIDREIGSFVVPTEWFQSVNPLLIVILAPLLTMLWRWLGMRGKEPSIPVKMSMGMILLGVGFLVLYGAVCARGGDGADESVKASILFILFTYLFHTLGELCLSPIGLSMVSKLAPVKLASLMMGVWLLSSFFANILGGWISSNISDVGAGTIFLSICVFSVALGVILFSLNQWLVRKSHGVL
ncbi:MAG: peptide MFS transporter [Paludibacteraceae bacterium]|nr:peptide MFS transporter [Paludibacteraceae bacterium]MBP5480808.1 peptide MFS transporter [Paludibacteraceae bacterium]